MVDCRRCNTELTVLSPWNSEGNVLTCTTPCCQLENRPQGWQSAPENKAFFARINEQINTSKYSNRKPLGLTYPTKYRKPSEEI